MPPLKPLVDPLEKVFQRVARLTADADGGPAVRSSQRLQYLREQFDLHLRTIKLDDESGDGPATRVERPGSSSGPGSSSRSGSGPLSPNTPRRPDTPSRSDTPRRPDTPGRSIRSAASSRGDSGRSGERDERILHDIERDVARSRRPTAGQGAKSSHDDPALSDLPRILAELDELIGMDRIKSDIKSLTNYLQLQKQRVSAGLPCAPLSLHTVFTGNPGTGKTTVARIVGQILGAMGILEHGHLVETDRSGLVAEYSGQTGPRTNRKIDEAIGGVLFIDEAYSLAAESGQDSYGAEAVQALLKRMEDDRDRLVVILAGYPLPMRRLLQSNPGLSSRFHRVMDFPDYEPVELARIFDLICHKNHFELGAGSRGRLLCGFDWLFRHRDQHFGNGRLARNLFEESIRALADRVVSQVPLTRELLTRIEPADLQFHGVPCEWLEKVQQTVVCDVACPACQHTVRVTADMLDQRLTCAACSAEYRVPWAAPVVDPI